MTPLIGSLTLRRILYYIAIALTVLAIIGYTLFQARFLLSGPLVTFVNTPESQQEARVVFLEGTAENIVRLQLNGRQIYTDKDGYFKEAVILENGYTVATLDAQDRYGRIKQYTHPFVYIPAVTK